MKLQMKIFVWTMLLVFCIQLFESLLNLTEAQYTVTLSAWVWAFNAVSEVFVIVWCSVLLKDAK